MTLITMHTVAIDCPIAEVYKFVVNMENFKQWFPGVIDIKADNALRHGTVGKKYLETVKTLFKAERQIPLEVIRSEADKLFVTEGTFLPLLPRMVVEFTEGPHKTTSLTWSMHSRNENFIFKNVLLPLLRHIIKKRARTGVLNLKKILENNSSQGQN